MTGPRPPPILSRDARAFTCAVASATVGKEPRPNSRRLESTLTRSKQLLAPELAAWRQSPVTPPTAWVPGAEISSVALEQAADAGHGRCLEWRKDDELAEAVRFELTEELPLRQFSRLQP